MKVLCKQHACFTQSKELWLRTGNKFIGLVLKILPLENSIQEKVTLWLTLIGLSIYLM